MDGPVHGGSREMMHNSIRRLGLGNLTNYILENSVAEVLTTNDRYLNYLIEKYRSVERDDHNTSSSTITTMATIPSQITTLKPFPLMSLPPELRTRIYQHAFSKSRVTVDTGVRPRASYDHNSNRQLLQCNRQIRSEALPIFATCTELTYNGGDLDSVREILPPEFVESVQRLRCFFFSPVGQQLAKLARLKVLEIDFKHTAVIHDMPTARGMEERCDELFVQTVRSDAVLRSGWPRDVLADEHRTFAVCATMEFSHQRYAEPFVKTCVDLDAGRLLWKENIR